MQTARIIDAFGGNAAMADRLNREPTKPRHLSRDTVGMWRMRGAIPARWLIVIGEAAAADKLPLTQEDIFGRALPKLPAHAAA